MSGAGGLRLPGRGRRGRLLARRGLGNLYRQRVADRDAVVETEHDDDGVRLFGRQLILDRRRPIERFVFRVVADQAGGGANLAHHAGIRLVGVSLIEAVTEPIGHRIADHDDGASSAASPIYAAPAPSNSRRPAVGSAGRRTGTRRNRAVAAADSSLERRADRSNNIPARPPVRTRRQRPQSPARR